MLMPTPEHCQCSWLPRVWNSSVRTCCLCGVLWDRRSYSKASAASVCQSPGNTGPPCPRGYFSGHVKPVQLGSTSGFKGYLKAAISSKEMGCSHAGWPRKLILFHGIKGISTIHSPHLRKEMVCIWSCKMHIWQTKLDKFQPTGKTCFPFLLFNDDDGNEAKWVISLRMWKDFQ